jgi:hypothetical protein
MMTAYTLGLVADAVRAVQKAVIDNSSQTFKLTNVSVDVMISGKKIGRIISEGSSIGFEPEGEFAGYVPPTKPIKEK